MLINCCLFLDRLNEGDISNDQTSTVEEMFGSNSETRPSDDTNNNDRSQNKRARIITSENNEQNCETTVAVDYDSDCFIIYPE